MILDNIVAEKKRFIETLPQLEDHELVASERPFLAPFQDDGFGIIAELKAKSPSEGIICANYQPVTKAKQYEAAGAAAISVLTDMPFFGGNYEHLNNVRKAVNLPLLCKDFIIDKRQVRMARHSGADACLLIVRILDDQQLLELKTEIERWKMTALIEVYDQEDCERAAKLHPSIVGINNRNLDSLAMDTHNSTRLKSQFPDHLPLLSLSGVKTPEDVAKMTSNFNGALIGTALMRAEKPAELLSLIK